MVGLVHVDVSGLDLSVADVVLAAEVALRRDRGFAVVEVERGMSLVRRDLVQFRERLDDLVDVVLALGPCAHHVLALLVQLGLPVDDVSLDLSSGELWDALKTSEELWGALRSSEELRRVRGSSQKLWGSQEF